MITAHARSLYGALPRGAHPDRHAQPDPDIFAPEVPNHVTNPTRDGGAAPGVPRPSPFFSRSKSASSITFQTGDTCLFVQLCCHFSQEIRTLRVFTRPMSLNVLGCPCQGKVKRFYCEQSRNVLFGEGSLEGELTVDSMFRGSRAPGGRSEDRCDGAGSEAEGAKPPVKPGHKMAVLGVLVFRADLVW